jgi:hypothetical protein
MAQAFQAVENVDPAIHRKWLDKHGFKPKDDGTFTLETFEGRDAVTQDKLFENIRTNVMGDYEPIYAAAYDGRVFVMVCGGPSLANHLDEIRAKAEDPKNYMVVCSNMTGSYLRSHGITPHVHFILDPQSKKRFDVKNASPETEYWINAASDPLVFEELTLQGIKPRIFLADFDPEGNAIKIVRESGRGMMAIQGGTMAGLRAMNIADARGFRQMEYYGFDATVELKDGQAKAYAYDKRRDEAIIEVTCDLCPEKFDTTLIFQSQVNEFLQWRYNMPWMDIKVIGGGLIAHCQTHVKPSNHSALRFTEEYKRLQHELHSGGDYGHTGKQYVPTIYHAVAQLAKRLGAVRVLDYGSASGETMKAVREHLWMPPTVEDFCYDPFVDTFCNEPEPADLLICTDVLEHVEPECTQAVLDHIQSLTRRLAFFSISLVPARKTLSDGRNAHINLRSSEFWMKEIKKRFITSEAKEMHGGVLLVVAQSIDDVKEVLAE